MQSFQSTIPQNQNHPSPYYGYGLVQNPKGISSRIKFNESAIYNLGNRDQYDWNKTFGLNGSQPGTECRWGWRWNLEKNCLELYPYVRINNIIHFDESLIISDIPLHEWLNTKIELKSDRYVFTANGQVKEVWADITQKYNSTCSYNALWFGGTSPAPNTVTVEYENFDPFVRYRLGNASQTWTVEYFDSDGNLATADGSPGESYPITAKIDAPKVVLGDIQVLPL
jgi:hypothetical protein